MATDIMRPLSVGPSYPYTEYMDTNTKVGGTILSEGFRTHLERFMHKATPSDRAKCLELLTSLDISKAAREQAPTTPNHRQPPPRPRPPPRARRPQTAMADIERHRLPGPYTTTYKREYAGVHGQAGLNARPQSTQAFQSSYELSGPIGSSTYDNEFYDKPQKRAISIRTGSSSGNRRNNPHPPQTFMNWRLPPRMGKEPAHSEWATELTDDMFDRVCRGQLRSTYQVDYLGLPQGHKVEGLYDVPEDWRSRVPYAYDSSQRNAFKLPKQQAELKGNVSRYGCNKLKNMPANGAVPAVPRHQLQLQTRTTYSREFQGPDHDATADVRDLGREHAARALARYQYREHSPGHQETLTRMLHALHVHPRSTTPRASACSSRSSRSLHPRPVIPPATCVSTPTSSHGPSHWEALGVAV